MKPQKHERQKVVKVGGYHTEEDTKKYVEAFRKAGFTDEQIKLIILFCGGYQLEGECDGNEII